MLMMLGRFGGLTANRVQLMLMMLGRFGGLTANGVQLMLMMLGRCGGLTAKPSAADAHDAGPVWGLNGKT